MVKHSNSDLLTGGARTKVRKNGKSNNLNIVFDEKSRSEYLTGFQKRNKDRKKKYLEKQKELLHQEKVEKRREKRKILREAISSMIKNDDEFLGLTKLDCSTVSAEIKFSDSNNTTTVVIEEL